MTKRTILQQRNADDTIIMVGFVEKKEKLMRSISTEQNIGEKVPLNGNFNAEKKLINYNKYSINKMESNNKNYFKSRLFVVVKISS